MNGRLGETLGTRGVRGTIFVITALWLGLACNSNVPRPAAAQPPGPSPAPVPAAARTADPPGEGALTGPVDVGRSPVRGPAGAPITLVLFSDFECPFCARVEPTIAALEAAYPGKIRVVWKHFPLDFHPHARGAARAAVAAAEQGKFWEMRDRMLKAQGQLEAAALEAHAQALGLDLGRFRASLNSPATDQLVEADLRQGQALGVTGTPAMFINRRRVVGAQPLEVMKAAVDAELAGAPAP